MFFFFLRCACCWARLCRARSGEGRTNGRFALLWLQADATSSMIAHALLFVQSERGASFAHARVSTRAADGMRSIMTPPPPAPFLRVELTPSFLPTRRRISKTLKKESLLHLVTRALLANAAGGRRRRMPSRGDWPTPRRKWTLGRRQATSRRYVRRKEAQKARLPRG